MNDTELAVHSRVQRLHRPSQKKYCLSPPYTHLGRHPWISISLDVLRVCALMLMASHHAAKQWRQVQTPQEGASEPSSLNFKLSESFIPSMPLHCDYINPSRLFASAEL